MRLFSAGFFVVDDPITHDVIAYASSGKWHEEHPPLIDHDPNSTHRDDGTVLFVTALAVRRDRQDDGVGSLLLERLRQVAQEHNCTSIVLSTSRARSFYEHRGFTTVGTHEDRGVFMHVMRRDL